MTRADRAIRRIREADRHGRPRACPICGASLRGNRLGAMLCEQKPGVHGGYVARWGRWRRYDYRSDHFTPYTGIEWDCQKDQFGIAEKRSIPSPGIIAGLVLIWVAVSIFFIAANVRTANTVSMQKHSEHKEYIGPVKPAEVWITGKVRTTFSMSFNDEKYRLNADSTVTFRDEAYDCWLTLPVSQVERFPKGSDEPPR